MATERRSDTLLRQLHKLIFLAKLTAFYYLQHYITTIKTRIWKFVTVTLSHVGTKGCAMWDLFRQLSKIILTIFLGKIILNTGQFCNVLSLLWVIMVNNTKAELMCKFLSNFQFLEGFYVDSERVKPMAWNSRHPHTYIHTFTHIHKHKHTYTNTLTHTAPSAAF